MTARSPQRQRLHDLLDPVVSGAGYELVDVTVSSAGRRSLVRVTVDGDAGIDLDAVADVSRAVSDALDQNDKAFTGPFVLEVSSPGVDRPLSEPRLWKRAVGRLVTVALASAPEPVTGRVVELDDEGVTMTVDGRREHHPWTEVGVGRVQVEFNRPGATGDTDDVSDDGSDDVDDSDDDSDDSSDDENEED